MQGRRRSHAGNPPANSAQATIHRVPCCVVGEGVGPVTGAALGFPRASTITPATTLANMSGMTFGLLPVAGHQDGTPAPDVRVQLARRN